jgi:hypothetical protein
MGTELIQGASISCSTVCWIALVFLVIALTATGLCLYAAFRAEEATQRKCPKQTLQLLTSDKHSKIAA